MSHKLIINRKSWTKNPLKLAIWEDFVVIKFHQKNEVDTIFNVQKCLCKGALAICMNLEDIK